jgi:hypothetical protein
LLSPRLAATVAWYTRQFSDSGSAPADVASAPGAPPGMFDAAQSVAQSTVNAVAGQALSNTAQSA